ncbi:MAG: hypothetical protein SFU84_00340 [Gemmatimonadales bacterium]|nr:hypothetical protein [Gemmatimonadales bacterium]
MTMLGSLRSLGLAVMVAGGLAACSDNPVGLQDPEVTNATDNFQFQGTAVASLTATQSYSWTNTGTRATINHSTTTTAGTALLTVRDAAGTVVYTNALVPSLNEPTAVGTAGTWTIVVTMTSYTGTLNFRAQKL